jgi:SNF family Na+-dependent transporter
MIGLARVIFALSLMVAAVSAGNALLTYATSALTSRLDANEKAAAEAAALCVLSGTDPSDCVRPLAPTPDP